MLRLFGFPVHVRSGFVIFLVLLGALYQSVSGLWLIGALAAFTLIHEFGHAVVARHFGAHAEISLDFMAGYTSYGMPSGRTLSRLQRSAITFAGPLVQIVIGSLTVLALGGSLERPPGIGSTDAQYAVWWAGPVIGVINLIPVLPLDGGQLALQTLSAIAGRNMLRTMAALSLIVTVALTVAGYFSAYRGYAIFGAFLAWGQLQILSSTPKPSPTQPTA